MTITVADFDERNVRSQRVRSRRALDLVLVVCSSPVWVPTLAIIAAIVVCTSGTPVLFTQERTGKHGKSFTMLKFRSMTHAPNRTSLIPSEDQFTGVGKLLRRSSLDELPQLLNVLRGDMSLVGPRPMLPIQSAELTRQQKVRQQVRPGMTGLAQVRGRNSITWAERIEFDQEWVHNPTLRLYVSILAQTFSAVAEAGGTIGHSADDPIAEPRSSRSPDEL